MTTTAADIKKVLELMDARLAEAQAELAAFNDKVAANFYLVAGRNDMVVVKSPDDLFRLDACSPDKGYAFPTFSKAKLAANKWNSGLDTAQKAARCSVIPTGRKQYLEYIVENLTELRPNMLALFDRLTEQER